MVIKNLYKTIFYFKLVICSDNVKDSGTKYLKHGPVLNGGNLLKYK